MAPNYNESLAIYKAFESRGIPLFFLAYYSRSLPRFEQVRTWLQNIEIGEVRHISSLLSWPPSEMDLSGQENFRTDVNVAQGGYFDDLASNGLDLFIHYFGNIREASGVKTNH